MAALVAFWGLFLPILGSPAGRARLAARTFRDWVLDLPGLAIQGTLIPLAGSLLLLPLFAAAAPSLAGSWVLPAPLAFLLNFVGVDYLYYWNHRLLHRPGLWPLHAVHHTMRDRDVLGTARNTLWTSFLLVYLWANSLFLFLLHDPAPFAASMTLTAILDLWRHSSVGPAPGSALGKLLGWALILPTDHAGHHVGDGTSGNYGANLRWWDVLHGTRRQSQALPEVLGAPTGLPWWRELCWPFGAPR